MHTARTALKSLVPAALLAAALTGCSGHGQYTQDHINGAQEKLSLMKSGTEWQMAHQQFMACELDKALKSVDRSIALNESVPKSHVLRGRIMMEKGELEAARSSFLEAEKLDPTLADAQYYVGIIHERFNEPAEAVVRYSNAMANDPSNAQYVVAAAEMYIQMNDLDAAEKLLQDRRTDFQYNAAMRQTLGHISMIRKDYAAAAQLFSEARVLAPDDLSILEDLSRAQMTSGRFAEAEFNLSRLLDAKNNAARRDLKHMRVACLVKLDRPVEARAILQDLTGSAEGAGDLQAWIQMGNVAATLNDSARLRIASARVIALAPTAYEGHFLRALHLRRQNDLAGALASADTAVQHARKDAGPWVLRAMIQKDLGQAAQARESLASALKIDPGNHSARTLMTAMQSPAMATHPAAGE
jgi:tetratricopeptide (TPR) repeat protein